MFFYANKSYFYSFRDPVCCFVFVDIAVSMKMKIMT